MLPRVAIGLPTYNRPDLLRQAVNSLLAQTYSNLDILISDNASTDRRSIQTVKELAGQDPRVRYVLRHRNDGAAANFKAVFDSADAPFFMWASDDDVWDIHFVERCLRLLEENPEAQMAFGGVDNINLDGVVVRTLPGFSRFTSSGDRRSDGLRFIAEPEILGKANLIYGLYRTKALRPIVESYWEQSQMWGGDMVLCFAFISRHPIITTDEVLLHKRVPTHSREILHTRDPRTYFPPLQHIGRYIRAHESVAPSLGMRSAVRRMFCRRIVKQSFCAITDRQFWRAASKASAAMLSSFFDNKLAKLD